MIKKATLHGPLLFLTAFEGKYLLDMTMRSRLICKGIEKNVLCFTERCDFIEIVVSKQIVHS